MWLAADELVCTEHGTEVVGRMEAETRIMPGVEVEFSNHMKILIGEGSAGVFSPGQIFKLARCRGTVVHRCANMQGLITFFGVFTNNGFEIVLPKKFFDKDQVDKIVVQMNDCVAKYNVVTGATEVEEAYIISVPEEFMDEIGVQPFTLLDLYMIYESHSLAALLLPMILYVSYDGHTYTFEMYNTEKTVRFVERLQKLLQHRFGVYSIRNGSTLSFNTANYQRLLARLEVAEKYPIFEQETKVVRINKLDYSVLVKNVNADIINGVKIK